MLHEERRSSWVHPSLTSPTEELLEVERCRRESHSFVVWQLKGWLYYSGCTLTHAYVGLEDMKFGGKIFGGDPKRLRKHKKGWMWSCFTICSYKILEEWFLIHYTSYHINYLMLSIYTQTDPQKLVKQFQYVEWSKTSKLILISLEATTENKPIRHQ